MLDRELGGLDAALAAARAELQTQNDAVADLTRQRQAAVQRLPGLREAATHLAAERAAAADALAPPEQALAAAETGLSAAEAGLVAAQDAVAAHDAEEPQPPDSPDEQQAYQELLKAWRAEGRQLGRAVAAAGRTLAEAQEAYDSARAARDQAAAALQAADARLQDAQRAASSGQAELDDLSARLAAAQAAAKAARQGVDRASAALAALRALRDAVTREPFDRTELEDAAAELGARLRELLDRQAAATAARADALAEVATLDGEIAGRQGELDALHAPAAIPALEATMDAASTDAAAAQQRLDAASGALDELESAIEAMREARPPPPTDPFEPGHHAEIDAWIHDIEELRGQYDDGRREALAATRALGRAQLALERAQVALAAARDRERVLTAELADRRARRTAAAHRAETASDELAELARTIGEYRPARETATARLLGDVPGDRPVVLLPVRLECRFRGGELLLRVVPDRIHVDTHEPGLTEAEQAFGRHAAEASAGADDGVRRAAWEQLAGRFGPERAAWIARAVEEGPAARPAAWTRAPHSDVLPDRWVAIGYGDDGRPAVTVWGDPVTPDPLPVGPEPQMSPLAETAGMRWMLDFDAAVACGMGLRLPLDVVGGTGFSRVVVLGIKAAAGDDESARRLSSLLDAHHYTDGLALVAQGTPTNSSAARPAGFASDDPGFARSYAVERGVPLVTPLDGSDGDVLAGALGLDPRLFGHVAGADGRERADARAMAAALWPMLDGSLLRRIAGDAGEVRDHLLAHVAGHGPLPLLRTGNEPYAILPATSLDRWAGGPERLAGVLRGLRETWRGFALRVRVASRGGDLGTIHAILREHAIAAGYAAPAAEGAVVLGPLGAQLGDAPADRPPQPNYLALLRAAGRDELVSGRYPGWDATAEPGPLPLLYLLLRAAALATFDPAAPASVRDDLLAALDRLAARPADVLARLAAGTLDLASHRLDAWVTSLATTRLGELRAAAPGATRLGGYGWLDDVRPHASPVDASGGFVQAPSLGHAATAAVLRSGYLAHRDGEGAALAVDLSSARVRSVAWLLDGVRQGQSLGALLGYRFERLLHDAQLDRFIAPLRTLVAVRDDSKLGVAVEAEGAATAAWRAAASALGEAEDTLVLAQEAFQEALAAQRRLEDERAELVARRQPLLDARAALDEAVVRAGDELSAAEAAVEAHVQTAPETRTVHTSNRYETDVEIPDRDTILGWGREQDRLEHERDAAAARLASAVADRQAFTAAGSDAAIEDLSTRIAPYDGPGGAIARAEAEAAARDADAQALAGTIPDLRTREAEAETVLAARRADVTAVMRCLWQQASLSIAASNVVDGLQLHRRWKAGNPGPGRWDGTTIPFGVQGTGLPAPGSADFAALARALDALAELVDAVGDTVLAESVHQLVQGNPVRSGGTIDAIVGAAAPPPDLEVVRTPRTGVAVTHRVLLLVPAGNVPPDAALAGELLPHLARVRLRATILPAEGGVEEELDLRVDALGLTPLDVLRLAPGALERQLEEHVRSLRPGASEVRLALGQVEGWPLDDVVVDELLEAVAAARALLDGARPLQGRDLARPEDAADRAVEIGDELAAAFAAGEAIVGDPGQPVAWFQRAARVRDGIARLDAALARAEALGAGNGLSLRVAQLPSVPGERWVALPPPDGAPFPGGRLSIVAQVLPGLELAGPVAGLLVDEWVEVVPAAREVTGVAFHYDQPNAEPPQAILHAVPPDLRAQRVPGAWDLDTLEAVVLETLELARLRAVAPEDAAEAGEPAAALFLPETVELGRRLEPHTRSDDVLDGLEARVHDPLWLLARQLQVGAFLASDGGTPTRVALTAEASPLTRYQAGGHPAPYAPHETPLAALVEAEPSADLDEAGRLFVRLLAAHGAGGYADAYRRAFPAGRVPDAVALASALQPLADSPDAPLPANPMIAPADAPAVRAAARAWLALLPAQRLGEAGAAAPPAWLPARMEYGFAVAGHPAGQELVLTAPEHLAGELDWHTFDGDPGASLGAPGAAPVRIEHTAIPAPVRYRGMPAPRFWELEDAHVDIAGVAPELEQRSVATLLLVEFALVYGNDWFLAPLELDVGSLCRITSLTVRDSFGETVAIPHAAAVDGPAAPWRMYAMAHAPADVFLLAPSLPPALGRAPIEDVLLVRDEMANLAWAIERVVQGPDGRRIDRYEEHQAQRRRREQEAPPAPTRAGALRYRLGSEVPAYWIPLVPEPGPDRLRLRRGSLPQPDGAGRTAPLGRILDPRNELRLYEEEVPREGVRVTRAYRYARWSDGSTHLWLGRRKTPGVGEGSSGLRFDTAE
jgi:hypothetical protein